MLRLLLLALLAASCHETFDAGATKRGQLPDQRNPVILLNDSAMENWMGEYALLLANSGGPSLAGIIVGTGGVNKAIQDNHDGWKNMLKAARDSHMPNIPYVTGSFPDPLVRPASGAIEDTEPSRSEGERLIREMAQSLGRPYRPLVIAAATGLTDVASAYLLDKSIAERVVVVASVGVLTSSGATRGEPNGEMDSWASSIVAKRLPYIQVSARYDSQRDVPKSKVGALPKNAFGDWIAGKLPKIWTIPESSDQVSIAAVGIPGFVAEVVRASVDSEADAGKVGEAPPLKNDTSGDILLVRDISADTAINRFWQMLQDPSVFASVSDGGAGAK